MRIAARLLLGLVAGLLLATLVLVVSVSRMVSRQADARSLEYRNSASHYVPTFCAVQQELSRDPFFQDARTAGDAAPLLNRWVRWGSGAKVLRDPDATSPLRIPSELPQSAADFRDWPATLPDVSKLEFGWMARLHEFDHWSILGEGSPYAGSSAVPVDFAQPDWIGLGAWAKFRLTRALVSRDPVEFSNALRDTRQLAWLLFRTDDFFGLVFAREVLRYQRQAASRAAWAVDPIVLSDEQFGRFDFIVRTSLALARPSLKKDDLQALLSCGAPPVTRCILLAQLAGATRYLEPTSRTEVEVVSSLILSELGTSPCSTNLARELLSRGPRFGDRGDTWAEYSLPPLVRSLPAPLIAPLAGDQMMSDESLGRLTPENFTVYVDGGSPF